MGFNYLLVLSHTEVCISDSPRDIAGWEPSLGRPQGASGGKEPSFCPGNIAEETWGVLVTEICAPCKGTSKSSLSLLACEDGEKPSVHEPGSRSSVDTESLGSLIFGLPGSRAVRNNKVIVWTTQSRDFCYTSQSSQRHLCLWPWEPLGSSALMQYLPLPSILLSYILR